MEITFTTSSNSIQLTYPKEFSTEKHLTERKTIRSETWGEIKFRECWFDGACLLCSDFNVVKETMINLQCDSFCWVMNFAMKGGVSSMIAGERLLLTEGRYQTFYCPLLDVNLNVDQDAEVFTICLTHRYISKLLGTELLPEQFQSAMVEPLTMVSDNDYRNSRIAALLKEIMTTQQVPYLRRVFLEAKILELLYLQLDELEKEQAVKTDLSNEEINRLQHARTIVAANLQMPCSLIELARRTGLNDFKLKRGFKALFGTTVFGYLAELRMQTAYKNLHEGKNVNEVSEMVGYKNPHHFSTAFKKRFGVLPSKLCLTSK